MALSGQYRSKKSKTATNDHFLSKVLIYGTGQKDKKTMIDSCKFTIIKAQRCPKLQTGGFESSATF